MAPLVLHRYSYADYLGLEEASNTKHEFLNGEIYAMAGGTPEHSALAVAVTVMSVVCGPLERDAESVETVTNPRLVVEVSSKSTEAYDRGQKLDQYRRIPSLQSVVLVSYRKPEIEVWDRPVDGSWRSRTFGAGQIADIEAPPVRLAVDEIYAAARRTST